MYAVAVDLELRASIAAPPSAVWRHLTDPALHNTWSLARMRLVSLGDADACDTVGAYRLVTVASPAGPARLFEVIEHSAPPVDDAAGRLVYRVTRGPQLLRAHRGEIALAPTARGTDLAWRVHAELVVPGVGALARRDLRAQLDRSLRALERVAAAAPAVPLSPPRAFRDADPAPLLAAIAPILDEQRALADELAASGDPKAWFARVYQYVTEGQLAAIAAGTVTHAEWALRLIPRFHHYYVSNLRAWRRGAHGETETPWALAFSFAESARRRPRAERVLGALLLGVRAHIDEDLPRALAEVYLAHFASRCSYARFRADYLLMAPIFRTAADRLLAELPRALVPWSIRAARAALPAELQDALTNRRAYDVPTERLEAFERGHRLARWAARMSPNSLGFSDA